MIRMSLSEIGLEKELGGYGEVHFPVSAWVCAKSKGLPRASKLENGRSAVFPRVRITEGVGYEAS